MYTFYTPELRRRKILNYPLGDVAMQVAKVLDMGGRVTADKIGSGSRAGRRNESLRRLARYSLLGTAIALLPMTQAAAGVGRGSFPFRCPPFRPTVIQILTAWFLCPLPFQQEDRLNRAMFWFPTSITLTVSRGLEPRS